MSQLSYFNRLFYNTLASRLRSFSPLIQIIIGPRQVGKTTAVKSFVENNTQNSTYISFDLPEPDPISRLRFEWDRTIKKDGHQILIVDEIQNIDSWPRAIKELFDRDKLQRKLSALGSSVKKSVFPKMLAN